MHINFVLNDLVFDIGGAIIFVTYNKPRRGKLSIKELSPMKGDIVAAVVVVVVAAVVVV